MCYGREFIGLKNLQDLKDALNKMDDALLSQPIHIGVDERGPLKMSDMVVIREQQFMDAEEHENGFFSKDEGIAMDIDESQMVESYPPGIIYFVAEKI